MTIDQFTKTATPMSCIVNFVNPVGIKLAELLLEQGSKLILIDTFTPAKKKIIAPLLKDDKAVFMDIDSTFRNLEKFKKIDYIYYFANDQILGSTYPEVDKNELSISTLSHKEFTRETSRVDAYIKLAIEFDAKFELITSAALGQLVDVPGEQNIQLQKYCESLLLDYYNKTRFNGRIVRLAEVYGDKVDLSIATNFSRLTREVLFKEAVNIYGEGLQNNYFVNYLDAVYGILKLNFTEKTKGKTYMLSDPNPVSTLSLAYRLLELTPEEKEVVFSEVQPYQEEIAKLKDLSLAPNATDIGWKVTVPFDQSLQQTLESLATEFNKQWKPTTVTEPLSLKRHKSDDLEAPEKGKKLTEASKVTKELVWYRFDYMLYSFFKNFVQRPFGKLQKLPNQVGNATSKVTRPIIGINIIPYILTAIILICITILIAPYVNFGLSAVRTVSLIKKTKADAAELNVDALSSDTQELPKLVGGMKASLQLMYYLQYIGGVSNLYTQTSRLVDAAEYYSKSAEETVKGTIPLITYLKEFKIIDINNTSGQGATDYFTELSSINEGNIHIYKGAQYAAIGKEVLGTVDTNAFPGFVKGNIESSKTMLTDYSSALQTVSEGYEFIPFLAGYKSRTNYLLMVQNETEIRSTGGWFTNYAIMGIENGKIRELTVDDVYNIDGQVTPKQAPQDMKDGLGLNSYKFSLSNWSPDVPKTASDAAEFLKQAGKVSNVNVVVTMNFEFVKDLLEVTGPIDTGAEYGQVSADNLFDKVVELHSTFVPGSQQKVGIVSTLVPKLVGKLGSLDGSQKSKLASVLIKSIEQRHIMLYSNNTALDNKLLKKYDTYFSFSNNDNIIFPVEWNWSGNKANKFVKRELTVDINEAKKELRLTTTYKNSSKTENYPEGKYKDFQRIYFPAKWVVKEVSGYTTQPKVYKESGSISYTGEFIEVPIQSNKSFSVAFTYTDLPAALKFIKQSGLDASPITINFVKLPEDGISEETLRTQGFTANGNLWTKTELQSNDVVLLLQ